VKLNVRLPLVNNVGPSSLMLVLVLSHCILLAGTGETRGVGLTVTVTCTAGPSLHPEGLMGIIVYVTSCGASVGLIRTSVIR